MKKIGLEDIKELCRPAYDFIKSHDMKTLDPGKYVLDDNDFMLLQSYNTDLRENRKFEAHKKYIDIQYIISGQENMESAPIAPLTVTDPYKEDADIVFYSNAYVGQDNIAKEGEALVFYPEDGHMPCLAVDRKPIPVIKAVIKVKIR